ncbi:MAG: hypothetical protein ACI9ON_000147 [Limisphaerales bacterium]|jgi:hypothetical protein
MTYALRRNVYKRLRNVSLGAVSLNTVLMEIVNMWMLLAAGLGLALFYVDAKVMADLKGFPAAKSDSSKQRRVH